MQIFYKSNFSILVFHILIQFSNAVTYSMFVTLGLITSVPVSAGKGMIVFMFMLEFILSLMLVLVLMLKLVLVLTIVIIIMIYHFIHQLSM